MTLCLSCHRFFSMEESLRSRRSTTSIHGLCSLVSKTGSGGIFSEHRFLNKFSDSVCPGRIIHEQQTHYFGRKRHSRRLVQPAGRSAATASPTVGPGDEPTHGSGQTCAGFRTGTAPAGDEPRAMDRHPRGNPQNLRDLAADAPGACPRAGAGPGDPGPDLFQGREPQPARQPQGQHLGGPGLLQQDRGHRAADDRDRGGPVGRRAVVRLHDVRREVQDLHGQGELPSEALSADDDAHLGRRCHRQPFDGNAMRPGDPGKRPRLPWQPGHRHQRGRGSGRHAGRRPLYARQRVEPRASAPDGHRPGGGKADATGRGLPGRRDRMRGRRQQFRRPDVSLPAPQAGRPGDSLSSPASRIPVPR